MPPLGAVPPACADLDVPPLDPPIEYAAWIDGSTIISSSHDAYYCQPIDFDDPAIDCPCSGVVRLYQYEFMSLPTKVGETAAVIDSAGASCRDACEMDFGEPSGTREFPVEILAVSETCIVGETLDLEFNVRFYADRQPCP